MSTHTILREIADERERQQSYHGWSTDHDDKHETGTLANAAASYALAVGIGPATGFRYWPRATKYWKPGHPRRMLVKAAALIVAEIERLDRGQ